MPWLNSKPFEIKRSLPFKPFKSNPSLCWALSVLEKTKAISSKSVKVV